MDSVFEIVIGVAGVVVLLEQFGLDAGAHCLDVDTVAAGRSFTPGMSPALMRSITVSRSQSRIWAACSTE